MLVFELNPIDLNDPAWAASDYKGRVIVRADTGGRARELAKDRFHSTAPRNPAQGTPLPPWESASKVSCRVIEGYPEEGPEGVLEPEEFRSYPIKEDYGAGG